MESKGKFQLATIDVEKVKGSESSPSHDDTPIWVQQTRVRRLFTQPQLFSFSASYLITWVAIGSGMYYALLNGGPVAFLFNYVIVLLGVLAQSASFAELASIQPVAGAQYFWTYKHAPVEWRRFLTWIQGWTTWVAYVACLASAVNSNVVIIEATIAMNSPSYIIAGWKTFLIFAANIVVCAVANIWFFWVVPWFEVLVGVLNVVFFFIFIVTLWVMSPRNSAEFLMERSVLSGWDNYFVSWNVGMLSQVWLFIGFECLVHMGEETKQPRIAVPRGMFWSLVANGILGLVMLVTFTICMPPDIEDVIYSNSPLVTILQYSTGSNTIATVLMSGVITMNFSCCMAVFSSASRLTWAWARDGGLPQYFGMVDGGVRVPSRAICLTSVLVLLLALLNLGSGTYTALGAITSLSVIGFYVSYAIMLAVVLFARYSKEGFTPGPWSLGRLGPFVNAFGLLFTCWTLIFLPFPSVLPVNASNMNWSLPAYVTIMILAVTLWFMRAKKSWPGPNQKVAEIVLRDS